ncbi:hypothetical protein CNYM01_09639 [Colletotrichum nymphaeae SA-01]|uniref:Uncharacterized protein n=1 Tax=Colletotrichum nymphaeae SA-01 TaxID=1460502 RepID=A0A135ULV8_9PEZI|nr:hypothetical protein CNYM01_09639 [Colletotrichum nymphaeae SA-01]
MIVPEESDSEAAIGSDMNGFAWNSGPWELAPSQSRHLASMKRHEEAWKIKNCDFLGSRPENVAALVRACASDPIHIGILVNKPMLQEDGPSLLANRTKSGMVLDMTLNCPR